jgi:hypothetical protein
MSKTNTNNIQITYLFGAGASANALPIVIDMPQRINGTIDFLLGSRLTNNVLSYNIDAPDQVLSAINAVQDDSMRELLSGLFWLKQNTKAHASVDTFAKKLYITRKLKDYRKLKASLTCFFIVEQIRRPVDSRYDSFFASILDADAEKLLPGNVKILSWNYDFQFEKAFGAYIEDNKIYNNQKQLKVFPSGSRFNVTESDFTVFKLNGTTGVYSPKDMTNYTLIENLDGPVDEKILKKLVDIYNKINEGHSEYNSLLKFAWEDDEKRSYAFEKALEIIKNTEVVVVIGYSFPFFNRQYDRKIFDVMKNVKTIYFQAPEVGAEEMRFSFRSINKGFDNIVLIKKTNQFFLPHEL